MNYTITTTLPDNLYKFVQQLSRERNTSYKQIFIEAISQYQQQKMAEEIKQGLLDRQQEASAISSEFSDIQALSIQE